MGLKVSDILALLPPSLYMPRVADMQLSSTARVTNKETVYSVRLIFVALCGCACCLRSTTQYGLVSFGCCREFRAGWLTETGFPDQLSSSDHTHTYTHTSLWK